MQVQHIEQVLQKLQALPPRRISEVEDFIDFLSQKDSDQQLREAARTASEPALNRLWNNNNDADYDQL